jgi:hypothetical protein
VTSPDTQIVIEVWDADVGTRDDFIASITMPLSQLKNASVRPVDRWFPLEKQGSLHLNLTFQYPNSKVRILFFIAYN